MTWANSRKFQYVPKQDNTTNKALIHSGKLLNPQQSIMNPVFADDFNSVLSNGTVYLPNFFCGTTDLLLFDKLKIELNRTDLVNWSKHFKFENLSSSETFKSIVDQMAKHFGVTVCQTRINYYPDGSSYKPLHRDKHFDPTSLKPENFTMGASFGSSRNLDFVHEQSKNKFTFPQNNGDVFAFDSDVNRKFLHGVPKVGKPIGDRISIIAWGIKK